jgi:hypothetical protein
LWWTVRDFWTELGGLFCLPRSFMTGMELLRQYRNCVYITESDETKIAKTLVFPLHFLRFALATDTGVCKFTVIQSSFHLGLWVLVAQL